MTKLITVYLETYNRIKRYSAKIQPSLQSKSYILVSRNKRNLIRYNLGEPSIRC
jgi:hypothetical protein